MEDQPAHSNRPKFVAEVSLGSIVSVITIIASAISVSSYIGRIDAKTEANSVRIYALEDRLNRDASTTIEVKRDNTARLDRIENKVDDVMRTIQSNQRGWRQ